MGRIRAHVWIAGRVQGVNFRYFTQREANRRHLSGWVCNLPDGRVEAVFEGEEPEVKAMLEWCCRGPAMARVERVEERIEPPRGEPALFGVR